MRLVVACVAVVALSFVRGSAAYNNGMGAKPPMGWNTWCTDDLCGLIDKCTDSEIRSVADAMIAQGMDKLGYEYINMDDCWSDTSRDAQGNLQPNAKQFPNGMKAVADYVHSKGLKFGLYTCVGTETCHGGRPGSYMNWTRDAETIASWGMDFVKADNCNRPGPVEPCYTNFSKALNATGRPILFSLCEWGDDNVLSWGAQVGQMLRIQMDHLPFWHWAKTASGTGFGQGTAEIIEYAATIVPSKWVKQYGWLDPDFLETLFPVTMPFTESRTEYTFWSLWSAPLLVSTDIRNMSKQMADIIMNPEVIAIDQDPLITAGDRLVNNTDGTQVWSRHLSNGDQAVVLFNNNDHSTLNASVTWDVLGWPKTAKVMVRDLWMRHDDGIMTGGTSRSLKPHDVYFFRATLQKEEERQ